MDLTPEITQLTALRRGIDMIDDHLVALLGLRMESARAVADAKATEQLGVYQQARHQAVLQRVRHLAVEHRLDQDYVSAVFKLITAASVETQQRQAPVGTSLDDRVSESPT